MRPRYEAFHHDKVCDNLEMDGNDTPAPPTPAPHLDPEDYYFDGPYMVFTAAYLLKRGTCCGSGCRHCPYRGTPQDKNKPA